MEKRIGALSVIVLFFLLGGRVFAQVDSVAALDDVRKFQKELNEEYRDPQKSPLEKDDLKHFEGHVFFPVNLKFRVAAKLKVTSNTPFFQMKTTTTQLKEHRIYGMIEFSLEGTKYQLPVYQSSNLMKTQEYKNYLFLPFTDLTNGKETYSGGRYIDLRIPEGEEIIVDFNRAYNPYCAYSHRFSCPIVPSENRLNVVIYAGVKYSKK